MSDWLKLHRKSIDSRVFSDAQLWRIWCWCLCKANWKRGWYGGSELQPGQFATGREAASAELGVSGSAWYRAMLKLQEFGCLRVEANNRFTIVSIVNWRKYQGEVNNERTTDEQRADNERTTSEQQADTIEEGLDIQEGKNSISFSSHSKNSDFQKAWSQWRTKSANQNGRPLDAITEEAQLMNLERFATEEAIEVIRFCLSLANCRNLLTNGEHKKPERPAADNRNRELTKKERLEQMLKPKSETV